VCLASKPVDSQLAFKTLKSKTRSLWDRALYQIASRMIGMRTHAVARLLASKLFKHTSSKSKSVSALTG
jgi:hypothetical protein